jgi:hypothetical protein
MELPHRDWSSLMLVKLAGGADSFTAKTIANGPLSVPEMSVPVDIIENVSD